MGMRSLLLSLAVSILLPPCYILFFIAIKPLVHSAMLIAAAHFTWLPESRFLDQCPVPFDQLMPLHDAILGGVSRYRKEVGQVKCVFCLCDVEEGEEVRELICRHLFHRGCLDRWLEFGRATCPLCRSAVVAVKVAEVSGEEMAMEMNDAALASVSYHNSNGWWIW